MKECIMGSVCVCVGGGKRAFNKSLIGVMVLKEKQCCFNLYDQWGARFG